jgi:cytoskeleton protein RodZ
MDSVGVKLRSEREKQQRSLSEIAESTCISSRYLQAIEEDDLKTLPGNFFYKSFVKQYCVVLGMEFSSVENLLNRSLPPEVDDPLPVLSKAYHVPPLPRNGGFFYSRGFWPAIALIAALGSGSGIYSWWQSARLALQDGTPKPARRPAPALKPPPVIPAPDSAPAPVPPIADPGGIAAGRVSVDLAAKEKTWVSVTSAGRIVFSGVLDASQTKNFDGLEEARLLTGNAAGIDVRWNGKPIGPIGPRGQVRTVLFTADSFRIVAPDKM